MTDRKTHTKGFKGGQFVLVLPDEPGGISQNLLPFAHWIAGPGTRCEGGTGPGSSRIYLGGTIFTQFGDLFCGGRINDGEEVAVRSSLGCNFTSKAILHGIAGTCRPGKNLFHCFNRHLSLPQSISFSSCRERIIEDSSRNSRVLSRSFTMTCSSCQISARFSGWVSRCQR